MKYLLSSLPVAVLFAAILVNPGCNEKQLSDSDTDHDTVPDVNDRNPLNNMVCQDTDEDDCDDCSMVGQPEIGNDGPDFDKDGLCNTGDDDDDNDNVTDDEDQDDADTHICIDSDADDCDDCSETGEQNIGDDGRDTDADGACDAGDQDDDNDNVADSIDFAALNKYSCSDIDSDGCDDCVIQGTQDPAHDGTDNIAPIGKCDPIDSDGDSVENPNDVAPADPARCRDFDADGCDDCAVEHKPVTINDGPDLDSDGLCDTGSADTSRPTTSECVLLYVSDSELASKDITVVTDPAVHNQADLLANGIAAYRDDCVTRFYNDGMTFLGLPASGCADKATIVWVYATGFIVKAQDGSTIKSFTASHVQKLDCPTPPGGVLASRPLECMGFGPDRCKLSNGSQNTTFSVNVASGSFIKRIAFVANDFDDNNPNNNNAKLLVQYRQSNGVVATLYHDKVKNSRGAADAAPISITINNYTSGEFIFTREGGPVEVRNLNVFGR